jgi:hypothetical protein
VVTRPIGDLGSRRCRALLNSVLAKKTVTAMGDVYSSMRRGWLGRSASTQCPLVEIEPDGGRLSLGVNARVALDEHRRREAKKQ